MAFIIDESKYLYIFVTEISCYLTTIIINIYKKLLQDSNRYNEIRREITNTEFDKRYVNELIVSGSWIGTQLSER